MVTEVEFEDLKIGVTRFDPERWKLAVERNECPADYFTMTGRHICSAFGNATHSLTNFLDNWGRACTLEEAKSCPFYRTKGWPEDWKGLQGRWLEWLEKTRNGD